MYHFIIVMKIRDRQEAHCLDLKQKYANDTKKATDIE